MVGQKKRKVVSGNSRRLMLAALLVPLAGCAGRGGYDPPAGDAPLRNTFVAVPARLGVPDLPLPDWTPELHPSRAGHPKATVATEISSSKPDPHVAPVTAITEISSDDALAGSLYRPTSRRMQIDDESTDQVAASDSSELIRALTDPRQQAELRLAQTTAAAPLSPTAAGDIHQDTLTAHSGLEPGQPIDLGAALGMAGGNAWTIQLARQKTVEALAEVLRAKAIWLPTLQAGVGWNKHDGRIQTSAGDVIQASRNSVFLGGGATLGNALIAGGSGGPFRLMADVAIAEAFFGPKIASRNYDAERFGVSVAKNQAMLRAGTAYIDLLEAAGRVADAQAAIASADELVQLTRKFEAAGAGAQADVDRAVTERTRLQQALQNATRLYRVHSASLAQRLRLDPTELLQPADPYLVPVTLISQSDDPLGLIRTAFSRRPEICEQAQRISALSVESTMEQVAPWIPNVTMATSAGMFSGGTGSQAVNAGGRGDVDLQALWELENMGRGVAAKRKRVASRLTQQRILLADLQDQIRTEVVQANENVANYWLQIRSTESALETAESSYQRNLLRVQNAEGLPIELLQAIDARADALRARTAAVADYNRAQLELLFATGQLHGEG
jgi:outer membrane protein TolC